MMNPFLIFSLMLVTAAVGAAEPLSFNRDINLEALKLSREILTSPSNMKPSKSMTPEILCQLHATTDAT